VAGEVDTADDDGDGVEHDKSDDEAKGLIVAIDV
jgi:hypothetical protein